MKKPNGISILLLSILFTLVTIGISNAAPINQNQSSGKEGGKCTVTSGDNKGKNGKYDSDGDCAGSWGATECRPVSGSTVTRCKDGHGRIINTNPGLPVLHMIPLKEGPIKAAPTVKRQQSRFTPYDVAPSRKEFRNRKNSHLKKPGNAKSAWRGYKSCLAMQKRGMKIGCNKPKF